MTRLRPRVVRAAQTSIGLAVPSWIRSRAASSSPINSGMDSPYSTPETGTSSGRAGGVNPASSPIAFDERQQRLSVVEYNGSTVGVVNTRMGCLSRTIGVGGKPGRLALDQLQGRVLVTTVGPCCIGISLASNGTRAVLGWAPGQALVDEQAGRVLVVNVQGSAVTELDSWAWVSQFVRQRLPFLPHPHVRTLPNSIMVFDRPAYHHDGGDVSLRTDKHALERYPLHTHCPLPITAGRPLFPLDAAVALRNLGLPMLLAVSPKNERHEHARRELVD